ncbi:MAG: glycosyltransferase [Clostridiales bacterium]|nr:glycosyltransferase [Clostridiales bacterium]
MPKISVIVPVYNTEKYLKKCLDSILNQIYQDLEIIVVNDGSTDNSEKIINEYVANYSKKIKYIKKENEGLSSARNSGIEIATGDYIAFVDSDDYIDENLFQKLLPYIEKNIDLIKFKLTKVDEKYNEIEKVKGPIFDEISGQEGFNKLYSSDLLLEPSCLYLYNMKFFRNNKFKFSTGMYHEDFGLTPIILVTAKNVVSIDYYGYYYVQAINSITRNTDYKKTVKRANDLLLHYDKMVKQIEKINLTQKTINSIKQYYSNAVLEAAKDLRKKEQDKYILEIKNRNLIKNLKVKSIKLLVKKLILFFNIKIYLKLK